MLSKIKALKDKVRMYFMKREDSKFFNELYGDKVWSRQYYQAYGELIVVNTKKLMKQAAVFDTVVPFTLFIPVILSGLVYLVFGEKLVLGERK